MIGAGLAGGIIFGALSPAAAATGTPWLVGLAFVGFCVLLTSIVACLGQVRQIRKYQRQAADLEEGRLF